MRFYSPLSLARLLGKTGYVARRWAGLYVMPYDIASRFLLLRRTVTLEGLLHVDLTVGRFFPFNRLGWNVIVAAQRRGAVA